jgi:very-short-patch-repair endonuclease
MHRFAKPTRSSARQALLSARAQGLRQAPTLSEAKLWAELSGKKLGIAFRRQVPVGHGFIVDFLAPSLKLVIEVDGSAHHRRGRADARRDEKLRRLGYRILRVRAEEVVSELSLVVERVIAFIAAT